MLGRYTFSIVIGAIITVTLLFVMQLLIVTGKQALTKPRDRHQLEFVRVRRNENLNVDDIVPEKPPKPPETPPETPPQDLDNINPDAPTINVAPPQVAASTDIGGPGGMNIAEGDYLPIVRVAPVYPARALSRGLEGFVDLQFTVTTAGTVEDPVVIQSTSSLFERAAIRAVLKFKYKPRVVDGVPVPVPGVKTRITFMLED
ncbi:MAG: energy transducer TonB [Gammaproteobacteria bacterium]|nr:energy transducer TonB [Gammaproteobacteria bacterium]NNF48631.1 energy transducer TonB [Woeseiaceae bacterium]MBT8094171.1 energy transducer TonB [Gammaproteobacteria bacterium]MBT8105073.1 energy transducer TonB [Gammaproteobacteria bacterium]NNK25087.1 energy transducer TonB [Woeseiaceae bacterium]